MKIATPAKVTTPVTITTPRVTPIPTTFKFKTVPEPIIPITPFNFDRFKYKQKASFIRKSPSVKRRYTPDVTSLLFGVTAPSNISKKRLQKSGLNFRPLFRGTKL